MKKVGIMQPYFFPYLGYFSLIRHTDLFILFDPVQYIRHGWIERNRILKQGDGWLYVQVPLIKQSHETLIKDVLIDNSTDWKNKMLAQIQPYKKIAPNYFEVRTLIEKIFASDYKDIVSLNKSALVEVCNYLSITTPIETFSKMNLSIATPTAPDEWALNICKAIGGVSEYRNPPGGKSFFDKQKYSEAGIDLVFHEVVVAPYNQRRDFIEGLSIIDVMMFNSPDEINLMLDNYELS